MIIREQNLENYKLLAFLFSGCYLQFTILWTCLVSRNSMCPLGLQ